MERMARRAVAIMRGMLIRPIAKVQAKVIMKPMVSMMKNSIMIRWIRRSCWKFATISWWYFLRSGVGCLAASAMKVS